MTCQVRAFGDELVGVCLANGTDDWLDHRVRSAVDENQRSSRDVPAPIYFTASEGKIVAIDRWERAGA